MRGVKRVAACAAVLALAGCGGMGSGSPSEQPGEAMQRLIKYELAGELELSYAMLVREQREIVSKELYVRCPPGPPIAGVTVLVLGVEDETIDVPALGRTRTKAVRWRMTLPDVQGDPIMQSSTGHLIEQEGEWRWTLSRGSFESFKQQTCPY
jgi:hypothetical protein